MSNTVEIKIVINGKEYSLQEAEEIYNRLNKIFNKTNITYVPYYPNTWTEKSFPILTYTTKDFK